MSTVILQGSVQSNQPELCTYWSSWLGEQVPLLFPWPDYFQEENIPVWKGGTLKRPKHIHGENNLKIKMK